MKKLLYLAFTSIFFSVWPTLGHAENLIQVYEQAVKSDPTYKTQEAQWLAAAEQAPIARAALLPSFITQGSVQQARVDQTFFGIENVFPQTTDQYSLNLNQQIFNYKAWKNFSSAKAKVKQAEATYDAAAQDLIARTTSAYFAVLQAYDQLIVTEGQKKALGEQLHQTQEQYKVGLIAITGVEQVKASYDATVAEEIANRNNISDKLEQLRAITGVFYQELCGVRTNMPLIIPAPQDINAWVRTAERQNYNVVSADYANVAAMENVKAQKGGHMPVIQGNALYTYQFQSQLVILPQIPETSATNINAGVNVGVNFPVYQGGLVTAQVRQAAAQYAEASAQLEQTLRQTLTQTRTSYLGVVSGVSKIKADQQAIRSNQVSLDATRASYLVGTATIVDVLQQQSNLYQAQSAYAVDQYAYLNSIVSLKQAAGTLSVKDVVQLNAWLNKNINFAAYNIDREGVGSYPNVTQERQILIDQSKQASPYSDNKRGKKIYAHHSAEKYTPPTPAVAKHNYKAPATTAKHKKKTTHLATKIPSTTTHKT